MNDSERIIKEQHDRINRQDGDMSGCFSHLFFLLVLAVVIFAFMFVVERLIGLSFGDLMDDASISPVIKVAILVFVYALVSLAERLWVKYFDKA